MGHPGSLHYACALAAGLLLSGCEDRPQSWSRSEIEEIVREVRPQPYGGAASGDDFIRLQGQVDALSAELEALRETVNGNADAANENRDTTNRALDAIHARTEEVAERLGM